MYGKLTDDCLRRRSRGLFIPLPPLSSPPPHFFLYLSLSDFQVRPLADPTEFENEYEHEDGLFDQHDGQGLALTLEGGDRGITQAGTGQQPQQSPLFAAIPTPVGNVATPVSGAVAVAVTGDVQASSPRIPSSSGKGTGAMTHHEA